MIQKTRSLAILGYHIKQNYKKTDQILSSGANKPSDKMRTEATGNFKEAQKSNFV